MSLAQDHFNQTKELVKKVDKLLIADWLLKEGYFPEQYVLPSCFQVENFNLEKEPYFPVKNNGKFQVEESQIETIFFPKTRLTDRIFGIIEPRIYHDIVWHMIDEWDLVTNHLFSNSTKIYCYSFPVPISKSNTGGLGKLRPGRMIYEWLEMAEKDLVADAFRYTYKIDTDITNFYPTIYTHSLGWALHGKPESREDKFRYKLLGTKIDKLFQYANDTCTNGLAIGPVLSDLTAEILLSSIDQRCSDELQSINFLGVRFKDDYKILCESKEDIDTIIKSLQRNMRFFNLRLNEDKTRITELPSGLFRPWIREYQQYSLTNLDEIDYKQFEITLLNTMDNYDKYPGTHIIEKFLSELITKDHKLKVKLSEKQIEKSVSLLFLLKNKRNQTLPQILSIIELILQENNKAPVLRKKIFDGLRDLAKNKKDYLYDGLWVAYFLKSQGKEINLLSELEEDRLFKSVRENTQLFFKNSDISLFRPIKDPGKNKLLASHLAIFKKKK